MKVKAFNIGTRISSFRFAFKGIYRFFQQEPNAWLHLFATIVLAGAIVYFRITGTELLALVIVTGLVWMAEAINTVVERIMDFISPAYHPKVEFIKDLCAGAVLIAAFTALLTGAIVFIPKII